MIEVYTGWDFRMWPLARLTWVAGLTGFSYKKTNGRFAGTKKTGRNNEVNVRQGSHCTSMHDVS